jgi:hypothetical protein
MLPGCLVDDPPAFIQPKRTPPRLDHYRARPPLSQDINARDGELLEFSIPVASEDVGEQLVTQSYIGKRLINSVAMPPSTLDDPEERLVKFNYQVLRDLVGYCHVITLRVGHASTLPDANGPPLDPSDVAVAYWDVIINFPSDGTTTPVCPLEDEATPR